MVIRTGTVFLTDTENTLDVGAFALSPLRWVVYYHAASTSCCGYGGHVQCKRGRILDYRNDHLALDFPQREQVCFAFSLA